MGYFEVRNRARDLHQVEDSILGRAPSGTLAAGIDNVATSITVALADQPASVSASEAQAAFYSAIRDGDILKIGDELVTVTAHGTSPALTISRATGETVAAEHSIAASVDSTATDYPESRAIAGALTTFSRDLPRLGVAEVAGSSSTYTYQLDTIVSGWELGRYSVVDVEFPVGESSNNRLEPSDWHEEIRVIASEQVPVIRFERCAPTGTWALWWSGPHTLTYTTSTLTPSDEEGLAKLVAAEICKSAAAYFSRKTETVRFGADSVSYGSLASRWESRAKKLEEDYKMHVNSRPRARSVRGQWSTGFSSTGRNRRRRIILPQ